jgi:hypothetical protein
VQIVVTSVDRSAQGFDAATKRADKLAKSVAGGPGSAAAAFSEADKKAQGLGGTLRRIGEVAAGVLLADALQRGAQRARQLISESVKAASDLGESVNAVNKVFGSASEQVRAWGRDNANAIGLSTRAFNQMATPLGSMLKNQGLALDQVTDHTIKLTERAADMASVFNTDVSDALVAIQAGLRGEQDPLERYGVSLSAVSVEARALADSHKTSAAQLTSQEKALARLNLIYDQTNDTAGDFRDTADGLANSQRIAAATMEEAKAKVGGVFIPVMAKAQQITGQFATTITSLPQPVVLVTAAVLGLGAASALLAPRIIATREALDKMAASDSRLQRSLQKTAVIAGKAATAFIALQVAGAIVSSVVGELEPQMDALTQGLTEWDGKARLAGESARIFGRDAKELDRALATAGASGFVKATDGVSKFVLGLVGADQQFTRTEARIRAVDTALADMVNKGHIQEAAQLIPVLATRAGVSVDQLMKILPQFSAAMETSGEKTTELGEAAKDASREVDKLGESLKKHVIDAFDVEEAEDKAADAVARLKDQVKKQREEHEKGAGALTGNTQAARDNRDSVRDLVGIYQDLVIEYGKAGKSTAGLDRQLEDTLVQLGFNKAEAHKYAKELGLIPTEVTTQVKLQADAAILKAQELHRELYRAGAGVTTVRVSARDPLAGGHAHGGIVGAESGGLRGGWTMTGERGRELVKLPYGSTVYPHGTTESMLGGGGVAIIRLIVETPNGKVLRDEMISNAVSRNVPAATIRVAYP